MVLDESDYFRLMLANVDGRRHYDGVVVAGVDRGSVVTHVADLNSEATDTKSIREITRNTLRVAFSGSE